MKRPRSPDLIGIDNYKKQRLLQEFENLRISNATISKTQQGKQNLGLSSLRNVINKKMWTIVEKEMSQNSGNDQIYKHIWDTVRASNLRIIKWYDWRQILYYTWLNWFQNMTNLNSESGYLDNAIQSHQISSIGDSIYYKMNTNAFTEADVNMDIDTDTDMDMDKDKDKDMAMNMNIDLDIDMDMI